MAGFILVMGVLEINVSLCFSGDFPWKLIRLHGELDTKNLFIKPRSRKQRYYLTSHPRSDSTQFKTTLVSFENNLLRSDPTSKVKSASSAPMVEVSFHSVNNEGDFYVAMDGAIFVFIPNKKNYFESHQ